LRRYGALPSALSERNAELIDSDNLFLVVVFKSFPLKTGTPAHKAGDNGGRDDPDDETSGRCRHRDMPRAN
jgi:hypothetical protein